MTATTANRIFFISFFYLFDVSYFYQVFAYLHGIQGGTLADLVAREPEGQTAVVSQVLSYTANEDIILAILREQGSMITRELRAACDFTGKNMRSKFDAYVTRLQMACYIVTEDFVYPVDKHGREYGFGWSLLTTPEQLLGKEACRCDRTPDVSYQLMFDHLKKLLPHATEKQIVKMLR